MRVKKTALAAAGLGLALTLAACGQNAATPSAGGASSAPAAASGAKVGVILPETASSARWEGFDKPLLTAAMAKQGLQADIQNAQGDEQKFSTLADGMISSGVKVLVIASISSEGGAAVEAKAKAQGIPVIDYDRLNLGGTSGYYVSVDNVKVGALQGQGLADALERDDAGTPHGYTRRGAPDARAGAEEEHETPPVYRRFPSVSGTSRVCARRLDRDRGACFDSRQ